MKLFARAIRIQQWVKNLLVFVPVLTAHLYGSVPVLLAAGVAFVAFCLAASSAYLLNDLNDLAADRAHPVKKQRPFASGKLPVKVGKIAAPILLFAALGLALILGWQFFLVLAGYFLLSLFYTLWLKKLLFFDVLVLATLYTLRIVAGSIAIQVPLSPWLAGFSVLIFLSLALVKRHSELALRLQSATPLPGRAYSQKHQRLTAGLGILAAALAAVVLVGYLYASETVALYKSPELLWVTVALLLIWLLEIWALSLKGRLIDDPLLFAVKDPISWMVLALCLVVLLLSRWGFKWPL